ncbi:MAG: restriction endonuclease subunit S [Deltaproteobacteria bacterium]|nr:restriction endonuclease subunit S [Deltaproteobacteria bacterium]
MAWLSTVDDECRINGLLLDAGMKHITKRASERSSTRLVPQDNLIVATRVGVGKITINKIDVAISQDLTALIVDKTQAEAKYLAYLYLAPRAQERLSSITRGTTIKGITRDDLLNLKIPLAPRDELRRIVAKIEALFDRIREAKRLRAETSTDTDILMPSALADVFKDLTSSWPVSTIKELQADGKLQIYGGGTPSKKNAVFWTGTLPWVSPKDMKRWEIGDTEDHISAEAVRASSVKLLPAGAVLIVVRGMILERAWPIAIARVQLTKPGHERFTSV